MRASGPPPRWWFLGALGVLAVVVAGMVFVMLGSPAPGSGPRFESLASEADLRDAGVMIFPDEQVALVWHVGQVFALSTRSPHLAHPIRFCTTSQWFEDPIHGEKYNIRGYHMAGPGPRGMDRHPFVIEEGMIKVATDEVIEGPPRGGDGGGNNPEGPFCVFDGGEAVGDG